VYTVIPWQIFVLYDLFKNKINKKKTETFRKADEDENINIDFMWPYADSNKIEKGFSCLNEMTNVRFESKSKVEGGLTLKKRFYFLSPEYTEKKKKKRKINKRKSPKSYS
jgi:hypothetical protein